MLFVAFVKNVRISNHIFVVTLSYLSMKIVVVFDFFGEVVYFRIHGRVIVLWHDLVVLNNIILRMNIFCNNRRSVHLPASPVTLRAKICCFNSALILVRLRWIHFTFRFVFLRLTFFLDVWRLLVLRLVHVFVFHILISVQLIRVSCPTIIVIHLLTLIYIMEVLVYILKHCRLNCAVIWVAMHPLRIHLWSSLLRFLLRVTSWCFWLPLLLWHAKLVWWIPVWLVAGLVIHFDICFVQINLMNKYDMF